MLYQHFGLNSIDVVGSLEASHNRRTKDRTPNQGRDFDFQQSPPPFRHSTLHRLRWRRNVLAEVLERFDEQHFSQLTKPCRTPPLVKRGQPIVNQRIGSSGTGQPLSRASDKDPVFARQSAFAESVGTVEGKSFADAR